MSDQIPVEPRGRFKISQPYLRDHWRDLQVVFAECVVVAVTYDFLDNLMIYSAYSRHFQPWPLGEQVPLYDVILMDVDGKPVFKGFEKQP